MKVRKAIEEGRTIVDPLRECGVFPNMVTQMIGVGEATGAMDSMLQKIADFYEDEVDAATKDMLAMLEPIIIGLLGIIIGGIVDLAVHAAVPDDRQTRGINEVTPSDSRPREGERKTSCSSHLTLPSLKPWAIGTEMAHAFHV